MAGLLPVTIRHGTEAGARLDVTVANLPGAQAGAEAQAARTEGGQWV